MGVTERVHIPHFSKLYEWSQSPERCACNKHITRRVGHLFLAVESAATTALDVVIGTGVATLHLVTAGRNATLSQKSADFLGKGSRVLVALPYIHLMKFLNPDAGFWCTPDEGFQKVTGRVYIDEGDGLLTGIVCGKIMELAKYFNSCHYIIAHTMTRLIYIINIPISIICRIIDFMIGLIAAIFSILTLGKIDNLNAVAYRGLFVGAIVADTFSNLTKAVNPWALRTAFDL